MSDKKGETKKNGELLLQLAILFAIGVLVTGAITYISQTIRTNRSVKREVEIQADNTAYEVRNSFQQYPAYEWLVRYWYDNYATLDIEYDAEYAENVLTLEKCRELTSHVPGIQLEYVTEEQLEEMDPADQKLYAEIIYSWLVTRLNLIKRTYDIDFLFCVVTDETYAGQFFLMSAADPGAVRGTEYLEVYTLGVQVEVSEKQQQAMQKAADGNGHLASAGDYVDYYMLMDRIDDRILMIGMTYNLQDLRESIRSETWSGSNFAMLFQIGLCAILLILTAVFVIRPLNRIQQNIRLYKTTKDSGTVIENLSKIKSHNEIGQLAEDVTSMTREMDSYMDEIRSITAEKERIGTELALATRIQTSMLPSVFPPFPERNEFDLYAVMDPAKEVGGDFYDFFMIDDDHLCMVMADVSGKGIPAALFMMGTKIILAENAMMGKSPARILEDTNKNICSHNREEMFVTVWLGILEISSGKMICANAGHEYPALMESGGEFSLYKDRHGLVIGAVDGTKYKEYELVFTPGSKLFVYTDGVPEATAADEEMFGTDRMITVLNNARSDSAKGVVQSVRAGIDEFVKEAEQFDDITMLCLDYRGSADGQEDI